MTGKDKHMPLYSSSDIEKYLSGELSDPEMHAMERAALDDPFLADALEGMVIHQSLPDQPSFQQDMAGLQQRLADRVSRDKKKVRLIPLVVRYAAAVILLLGLGVTAYYMFNVKNAREPLAQNKIAAPATSAEPATMDTAATTAGGLKDSMSIGSHFTATPEPKQNGPRKAKGDFNQYFSSPSTSTASNNANVQRPASSYVNNASNGVKNNLNTQLDIDKKSIPDSLIFKRDTVQYGSLAFTPTRQREKIMSFNGSDQAVYKGRVINPQNIPLAGATLSLKKGSEQVNTVTDANGNFTIKLPRNDTLSRVVVNYIGYEQGYAKLNTEDKTGNIIQLRPQQSSSLDEVVVVGFGSKRKELTKSDINSTPLPLSQTAVPTDGWPVYNKYLESNKNSPQIDTTIRGYESISFIVNKKGELSSFRVERSLSPAHDSLAIRLVKEGPSWKLLKGKKEKARVILAW